MNKVRNMPTTLRETQSYLNLDIDYIKPSDFNLYLLFGKSGIILDRI